MRLIINILFKFTVICGIGNHILYIFFSHSITASSYIKLYCFHYILGKCMSFGLIYSVAMDDNEIAEHRDWPIRVKYYEEA